MTRRACALAFLLGIPLVFGARSVPALDGVIEINQSRALAGGIGGGLPQDPPGFPVTITQPGSYRLTSNLAVASASTNGIEINAPGVSLDLGGFEIRGPGSCSCCPISCAGSSGAGVLVGASTVSVTGGSIRGFGSGVSAGSLGRTRIEQLDVSEIAGIGLAVSDGSRVANSTVRLAAHTGIVASQSIVERNTVDGTGLRGISAIESVLAGNTVVRSGYDGIVAVDSIAVGSAVRENARNGVRMSPALVLETTAVNNGACGIVVESSTLVRSGATAGNTIAGLRFASASYTSAIGHLALSDTSPYSWGGQSPAWSGPVACGNCVPFYSADACEQY